MRLTLLGLSTLLVACSSNPAVTGSAQGGAGGTRATGGGGVGGVAAAGGGDEGCGVVADLAGLGVGDAASHPPPDSGMHLYSPPGSWLPGAAGFVGLGESYVDPVFGSSVRRITDVHPGSSGSQIYVRNGFWNADGTLFMHHLPGCASDLVDTTTGAVVQAGVPGCWRASFDPVDPAILYYPSGSALMQVDVTTGDEQVLKDFGGELMSLGGSVDYIDKSGRYFVVNVAGSVRIWDKQADSFYAGELSGAAIGTGWVGISPDAGYLIVPGDFEFWSYAIDHQRQALDTDGNLFWTLCGDHADVVSSSDGKTYLVAFECWDEGALYRVDVSLPQSGQTQADRDKQRADNVMLVDLAWEDSGHISCVTKGPNRDWCFYSATGSDDSFGDPGAWRPYKQEILMMQTVEPFTVRRLAHHRSRSPGVSYQWQPRVSSSWCGNVVGWVSNFGYDGSDYADVYAIHF
jgi:hypothetical protein